MASIYAILKINDEGNGILESYSSSTMTNNLSLKPFTTDILSVINGFSEENKNFGGAIGTPIGNTTINNLRFGVINSSGTRIESYNGLMFGYSDSNKNFQLELNIKGTDIISFKIFFDKLIDNYPVDYTWYDIDGNSHETTGNQDNEILFEQRAGYGTSRIVFTKWNKANSPIAITFVENIEIDVFLDKRQIVKFETQTQQTNDPRIITNSALANTGQILLKDFDKTTTNNKKSLLEYAKLGYLNVNVFNLELYINNKLIQNHISNQTPYFNENKTMQFQLTNEIEYWNQKEINETTFESQSLYSLLLSVFQMYDDSITQSELNNMLSNNIRLYRGSWGSDYQDYSTTILDYLNSIVVGNFTLKKGTFLSQIEKICITAQLQCYIDDNNQIKFKGARPVVPTTNYNFSNAIVVPFNKQLSQLDYDILVANRYEDVEIK